MGRLNHPDNLKYSKTDEWVRVQGNEAVVGITDYAQDQLGDMVYIEWDPKRYITQDEKFAGIESVKATSELTSPVSGIIVEINEQLKESPDLINDSPYNDGWMLVVHLTNPAELDNLMDANEYIEYIQVR